MKFRGVASILVLLLSSAGWALAQGVEGDPVAGRALAVKVCGKCHSVSAEQRTTRFDEAPGFDEIADKPQTTEISLRAFLQSSHPTMPNILLAEQERDDVIAYILSLRQQSL